MKDSPVYSYKLPDSKWIEKLIRWSAQHHTFLAFTTGNRHDYPEGPFVTRFYAGNRALSGHELWSREEAMKKVGVIGYDFKNRIEKLKSGNPKLIDLPELCFFCPEMTLTLTENTVCSEVELDPSFWTEVASIDLSGAGTATCVASPLISRESYLTAVQRIQDYILEGDTYEVNFCQAYHGEFQKWDPITSYFELNRKSPMPFSALFKAGARWLVSASPERFLKCTSDELIAQPMKGTAGRGKNEAEDDRNRNGLSQSEKERAENLMITDLMRNDLSKVSLTGSVQVKELFRIYPLPRVFQMISTVSSMPHPNIGFREIINATFPMGSMTGAPKIRTMEIIEELESFNRGWFSGAFGVIEENGDFDFSVIIRSIIADLSLGKLYFAVGSAITFDADAAQEYEECMLKAQAILEVLSGKQE